MSRLHHQYSLWHLTSYLTNTSKRIVYQISLDYDAGHIELLLTPENSNHQSLPWSQWLPSMSHYAACWPWKSHLSEPSIITVVTFQVLKYQNFKQRDTLTLINIGYKHLVLMLDRDRGLIRICLIFVIPYHISTLVINTWFWC